LHLHNLHDKKFGFIWFYTYTYTSKVGAITWNENKFQIFIYMEGMSKMIYMLNTQVGTCFKGQSCHMMTQGVIVNYELFFFG
jgi:hypothetical protein